ncbi:MAG: agmatinase [Methanospirillum sp.]|nr:agmatinase [Methanospirillum sp.]
MPEVQSFRFADALASYEDARYVLLGVPFDNTTSYRPGTRFGPRAIREVTYNFEPYVPAFDLDMNQVPLCDLGDLEVPVLPGEMVEEVRGAVSGIVRDGKVPVLLGGEHTLTIGAAAAVRPEWYVVLDAHLDLRSEYRGTRFNHACTNRVVSEETTDKVVIIGARSGDREQYRFAGDLLCFSADEVRRAGIGAVLTEVEEAIGRRSLYLSIDADAIDCCLTPGLGTPEPFGLTPYDVRTAVERLAPLASGFDYVEVCPIDDGQTAAVAAEVVRLFVAAHWSASRQGS